MAIKYYETYPQRWDGPSQDYPQGAFKNLSALGEQDGSYLEKDWLNDQSGFFGALLRNAEMTPNGLVDTARQSQFYEALLVCARKAVDLSNYYTKTQVDDEILANKTEVLNEWGNGADTTLSQGFITEFSKQFKSVNDFDGISLVDKFINASSSKYFVPIGEYNLTIDNAEQLRLILSNLKACFGNLNIKVNNHTTINERININCIGGENVSVTGNRVMVTATSNESMVSGTGKNYRVTYSLSGGSVAVGDIIVLFPSDKINQDVRYCGGWEVVSVDGLDVTVKNTSFTKPLGNFNGNCHILKSSIKVLGDDCFYITNGKPFINDLALIGDYDLSTDTGTFGTHGITINAPSVVGSVSSNTEVTQSGGVRSNVALAILNFGEQGIASESGNSSINFISVTGCRKRGIYSSQAYMRCKFSMCIGNGEDGFISDFGGTLDASHSIAGGNGFNGYWSTNMGMISAPFTISTGNMRNGYESRGNSRIGADKSYGEHNGMSGYYSSNGGMIYSPRAKGSYNEMYGFEANRGSVLIANESGGNDNKLGAIDISNTVGNIIGNTQYGYVGTNINLISENKTHNRNISITSVGDMVLGSQVRVRTTGDTQPLNNGTQNLGGDVNRWRGVYLTNNPDVSSDLKYKSDVEEISDALLRVASKIKRYTYRSKFNDKLNIGYIAQNIVEAFESEGINPFDYNCIKEDSSGNLSIVYTEVNILIEAYILSKLK